MRILVYPHSLEMGGSQINAIDVGYSVAAAGHEVMVYGVDGPLAEYIEERGLRFIRANPMKMRPAPTRISELMRIVKQERIDLIHAYEWPPALDAYFGAGLFLKTPVLCSVCSIQVMPQVPSHMPLIMVDEELGEQARKIQKGKVWVLEAPIDSDRDHPGIDGSAFRRSTGVADDELLIVTVSRLSLDLKIDALVRVIDAAGVLAERHRFKLVVVGDGPAYDSLLTRANAINARFGREVIKLHGYMLDSREAYAAADITVGMGSSALRAMSIARPVVVQGETGFSEIMEPDTLAILTRHGFYGNADSAPHVERLVKQIEALIVDPARRQKLCDWGRETVVNRFSLHRATRFLLGVYDEVIKDPGRRTAGDMMRSVSRAAMMELEYKNPSLRRRRKVWTKTMLEAARSGNWPPAEAEFPV